MNALDDRLASAAGGQCLNCAAPLSGPFCANCGQKARLSRSLAAFFSDLVSGLFNFESRFWRTLPMLAWCPGDLTRRYVEGQRARFISPIALYLFSVFLMFAALSFTGGDMRDIEFNSKLQQGLTEERAKLAGLEEQRAAAIKAGTPTAQLDRQIKSSKDDIAGLEGVANGGSIARIDTGDGNAPPWLLNAVGKLQRNPGEVAGNVQEAASKYSWALIPLSVPFMMLLFPFSRRHVFDHAVFVTYSLSFMLLLILAGTLMVAAGAGAWVPWLLLLPPVHIYRQLKGAYGLRWWSAALRTLALLLLSAIALSLFAVTVVALGLLG